VVDHKKLVAAYYRLRQKCSVLKDGGGRFEGKRWELLDDMVCRKSDGWELRVYPIEDVIEVCLIDPNGNSKDIRMNNNDDPFEVIGDVPEGWSYQWVVVSILGSRVAAEWSKSLMERDGWTSVPAARHPDMPCKDGKIEIGGCVLMERPAELTQKAKARDENAARKLAFDATSVLITPEPGCGSFEEVTAPVIVQVTLPLRLSIRQVTAASVCGITPEEYGRRLILLVMQGYLSEILVRTAQADAFELREMTITIGDAHG
jgi:hypothetical protein